MRTILLTIALLFPTIAQSGEREESARLAIEYGGVAEYMLFDRTRVDILTNTYAIEVEYPAKWAEAVGQSLYYAAVTNRKPAIIFLVTGQDDNRFVYRAMVAGNKFGITVFIEVVE